MNGQTGGSSKTTPQTPGLNPVGYFNKPSRVISPTGDELNTSVNTKSAKI